MGLSYNEEQCIKNLIQEVIPGSIDMKALENLLKNLGIEDEKPQSNKHLDYSKISGSTIRIFNKLNHDMNEQSVEDLGDFIGPNNFQYIDAIIAGKSQRLEVIDPTTLRRILQVTLCTIIFPSFYRT